MARRRVRRIGNRSERMPKPTDSTTSSWVSCLINFVDTILTEVSTVSAPVMAGPFVIGDDIDVKRFSSTSDGVSLGEEGLVFVGCALVCFVEPGAAAWVSVTAEGVWDIE